ncbi:hypothetical protein AWM68_00445 [Fictibacillus phosphorivorans]|uniref:Protein-glutamine gamma-glutamyltransferase-like C-terminal domain-containing protein n=1 Tax=Fictibacillus phosphorivorans TaxID=1221500 RepID=A0A165P2T8_9BACL|nr:DUF4129 domain-containing protein [Fictibacillus phosphorivorans]KZE68785.1 hypothetical protein AWM68_00445 [Fictibacillus phosphorivorans]
MLNSQRLILYGMNMIFDSMLLFLLYVLLLQGGSWQDLLFYITALILIIALSGSLFTYKPSLLKGTLVLTLILSIFLFWLLTSSLLFSAILSSIFIWRSTENWQDPLKADLELLLAVSVVLSLLLSFFFKDGYTVMYGAVWLQFLFMLFIKMTVHYFKNPSADKLWKDFSIPISVTGLSAVIFIFLGPLKQFIYWLVDGVLFVLYYVLAMPLWKLFSFLAVPIQYLIKLFEKDEQVNSDTGKVEEEILLPEQLESPDFSILWWSIVILFIMIAGFYIWRKKALLLGRKNPLLSDNLAGLSHADLMGNYSSKKRWLHSNDRTRKRFLRFEKTMDKRGFSRLPGESPALWFERLKLSGDEAESVLKAYEKVRYGEEIITNEEFNHYAAVIKKLEKSEHLQKKKSN